MNAFVLIDYSAPHMDPVTNQVDRGVEMLFPKGKLVSGEPIMYQNNAARTRTAVLKTATGHLIPKKYLGEYVEPATTADNAIEVAKLQANISKIANRDLVNDTLALSKRSIKGVAVGTIVGSAYALIFGKSVLVWGILGSVAGGFSGYYLAKSGLIGEL